MVCHLITVPVAQHVPVSVLPRPCPFHRRRRYAAIVRGSFREERAYRVPLRAAILLELEGARNVQALRVDRAAQSRFLVKELASHIAFFTIYAVTVSALFPSWTSASSSAENTLSMSRMMMKRSSRFPIPFMKSVRSFVPILGAARCFPARGPAPPAPSPTRRPRSSCPRPRSPP